MLPSVSRLGWESMSYHAGYECRNYAGPGCSEACMSSDVANGMFLAGTPGGLVGIELVAVS